MEKILKQGGNWNEKQIIDDASKFLDAIIKKGNSLKINEDLFIWSCMLNHKVMLDMELTYEEAKEFYEMIIQSMKIMVSPEILINCECIGNQMKLPETRNYRKTMIEKYKVILKRQYEETSEETLCIMAAAFYDIFMFAGGLSVPLGIHNALAVIYSSQSPKNQDLEINEENLTAFVFEVLRFYPLVMSVHYITGDEDKQRKIISIANALRDPEVWGEDVNEFRLREIATYHELSTMFGEKMIDKENPANNRYCPGKDFALQMIFNFLKAFFKRKENFNINKKVHDEIIIGINNLTTTWEFEIYNT